MNAETKTCQNCKNQFAIEPEDFGFYEKMGVPPPTWCPECRFKRRALFRNERKLFRREDARTGETLLSLYPPESGYPVYRDKDWWNSDLWDPLSYGADFDPNRPFLLQLFELLKRVPKFHSASENLVASDYSANSSNLKNCYLLFNSNYSEDCAYGNGVDFSRNCYDNSHVQKSERCYDSFWLTKCYETRFSSQCEDCASVWFSKNCRGCTDCFGCVNLRSQKYCIWNEQYSKEEYEKRLRAMRLDTWQGLQAAKRQTQEFWLKFPNKNFQGVQNINVSGEYITHSKNVKKSYLIRECENLAYVQYSQVPSSRDCMDGTIIGNKAELFYEVAVCGWGSANLKFCAECWSGGRELEYCMFCARSAANCFGCVGILNNQYCILNKQYSKEDYFALRERIIGQMNAMPYVSQRANGKEQIVYKYGEFFPPEFSPFAYQHAIVAEHFSMTREEVEAFGARWQDPNPTEYQTTMSAASVQDSIKDVNEDILKEIIQCEDCKRAYRLIGPELQFLKQLGIPAPRVCVDCRHNERIAQRNKSKLYARRCGCVGKTANSESPMAYRNTATHFHGAEPCPNEFETSYAPDRPEIVYCEQCYNAEVA